MAVILTLLSTVLAVFYIMFIDVLTGDTETKHFLSRMGEAMRAV